MYKVLVGIDGSEGAAAAVAWCAQVGPLLGAEVIAVHALTTEGGAPSDAELEEWCAPMHRAGLSVRRVIDDEDPARLVQRVASAEEAGLVVVGATHHGELAGLITGSVVERLAYHARCPVVIVPVPRLDDP
jgi:nucleotide-binding universal stress UspA family protein